jgi:N-acetyl sugar amidotransferase
MDEMRPPGYRMCVRCIMDTSDPDISFDAEGVCSHCRTFAAVVPTTSGQEREARLEQTVDRIRKAGRGRPYDCLIGLSGGVDSTYVAYLTTNLGLRPLAVHLDNGWDSELAVKNIEHIVNRLGIDLHTHVLDWPQFRDLQLAFLKASVPDGEIPTDHAILAVMMRTARQHGIPFLMSGVNLATEGILPTAWTYDVSDWAYVKAIHRRFGTRAIDRYPHFSLLDSVTYVAVRLLQTVRLLDLVEYEKSAAMRTIETELGWRYYGGKHYESIYTRFFQGHILPRKFGIDKRRAHLSTLINSGQTTRDAALDEMLQPPLPPDLEADDREYVIKKLGLASGEFDRIMALPTRSFRDYPNSQALRQRLMKLARLARRTRLLPQRSSL